MTTRSSRRHAVVGVCVLTVGMLSACAGEEDRDPRIERSSAALEMCSCATDCGTPTYCFVSILPMRGFRECNGETCQDGYTYRYDCSGVGVSCSETTPCSNGMACVKSRTGTPFCSCSSDAQCNAGQRCIQDDDGLGFCHHVGTCGGGDGGARDASDASTDGGDGGDASTDGGGDASTDGGDGGDASDAGDGGDDDAGDAGDAGDGGDAGACTGPEPRGGPDSFDSFNETDEYGIPFSKEACDLFANVPYIGAFMAAGNDDNKISWASTTSGSSRVTGKESCGTETTGTLSSTGAVNICAWQAALKGSETLTGSETRCVECEEGTYVCGAMSCNTFARKGTSEGSLTRTFSEKSGLGDLFQCGPADAACEALAKRLNEKFEILVSVPISLKGSKTTSVDQSVPGSCNPCGRCTTTTNGKEGKLSAQFRLRGTFNVVTTGSKFWDQFFKLSVGLEAALDFGIGAGHERKIKQGECGKSDCTTYYVLGEVGGGVHFRLSAGRAYRKIYQWNIKCRGRAQVDSCQGINKPFTGKCTFNDGPLLP